MNLQCVLYRMLTMLQLPFMWKQFQQFLMSSFFVIGHSGDDIIQIIPWVYIMCLTGGQQGTDHRHISRRLMVAAEEVIFPSLCWHYIYVGIIIRDIQ